MTTDPNAADFGIAAYLAANGVTAADLVAYDQRAAAVLQTPQAQAILAGTDTTPAIGDPGFDPNAYFAANGVTLADLAAYDRAQADPTTAGHANADGSFVFNGLPVTLSYFEDFGHGPGLFTNLWGNASVTPGAGAVARSAPDFEADAGVMVPASGPAGGFGYGLFVFGGIITPGTGPGGYICLWPSDDRWPGPEQDLVEIDYQGRAYGTVHWAIDGAAGSGGQGNNGYKSVVYDGVDPSKAHFYWIDWQPGRLTYGVDDRVMFSTTDHVPKDAADGGVNLSPGIGEQTWWSKAAQHGQNATELWGFAYMQHAPSDSAAALALQAQHAVAPAVADLHPLG